MNIPNLSIPQDKLAEFCRKNHIRELSIFGSALRDDFGPHSDVDVLVEFQPDAPISLLDFVRIQQEIRELFGGRQVDLVSKAGLLQSENYIRRKAILESTQTIYVA